MKRKLEPQDARQGRLGKPVLIVLVVGILLALVAWGGAEWYGEETDPVLGAGSGQTGESGQAR